MFRVEEQVSQDTVVLVNKQCVRCVLHLLLSEELPGFLRALLRVYKGVGLNYFLSGRGI